MDDNEPLSKANHPARRRFDIEPGDEQRLVAALEARVNLRMNAFESKLDANTELTRRSVDMFEGLQSGIKALGAFSTFAKWLAPIVACGGAIYAVVTGRPLEK